MRFFFNEILLILQAIEFSKYKSSIEIERFWRPIISFYCIEEIFMPIWSLHFFIFFSFLNPTRTHAQVKIHKSLWRLLCEKPTLAAVILFLELLPPFFFCPLFNQRSSGVYVNVILGIMFIPNSKARSEGWLKKISFHQTISYGRLQSIKLSFHFEAYCFASQFSSNSPTEKKHKTGENKERIDKKGKDHSSWFL